MDPQARLYRELTGFLRQHCPTRDERHLTLLGWMVAGLLLSQTVCFDHWQRLLPLHHCLAASWQRRCRRWLGNERIDAAALYGPLVLWAIRQWQKPGHTLAARHKSETLCAAVGLRSVGGPVAMRAWGCQTKPRPRGIPCPTAC